MRYLLWPAVLLVTACVYVFFAGLDSAKPQIPQSVEHDNLRKCRQVSTAPIVKLCSDRGYIFQDGRWTDIGPAHPLPGVPAR